ncbi:MAG: glutathione S-transferase N-terminal domain-containing protein [Halioglobus sp.]
MITIHHSPMSRSTRVVWFCEEIGLPYALETVEMFSDAMKRPEYLAVNPLGKVPAIEDDGFVLWETSAILQYLDAVRWQPPVPAAGYGCRRARHPVAGLR